MPDHPDQAHYFGGGISESNLSPFVLALMAIAIILILCLPRKHAVVPLLLAIFLIPLGQQFYALGVHWLVSRIVILVGLGRVMTGKKGSFFAGGYNSIDRAFIASVVCESVAFILLFRDGSALVNQFGFLIDYLGAYILLRALLLDEAAVYLGLKCLAVITVIMGCTMVREQQTLQNVFGLIGGAMEPLVREGKIRSQGAFQHSLTAGTFAATLVPMFLLLWSSGKAKLSGAIGLVGCSLMTICSNSSTPLLGYAAGLFGICFWPLRNRMKTVRWILVISLVSLHMIMKAPVWFLLAHIDLTGGSSGYHRAELVDQCIRHFWDWWLIGTKDAGTWAWDMWDSQNQYVQVAETGGLAALVYFIVMIKRMYAGLGNARKLVPQSKRQQWALWLLGSALFAHLTSFFGINYFDQARVNWFLLIAAISAFTSPILQGGAIEQSPKTVAADSASVWARWDDAEASVGSSQPGDRHARVGNGN
jgi:hypothetical protein